MARTVVRIQTISLRSPKQKLGRRTSGVDPIKINAETVLKRSGYTVFEVLALAFVLSATLCLWRAVTPVYGQRWGMLAAFGGGLLSVTLVVLLYRWSWRRDERLLQAARENYRKIYRVIAAPADPEIIGMADGAVIRVGDFGWEAGPARDDGLIYLQGLTLEWTVVWHAGLRPEEVESVTQKPHSQYDAWHPYWAPPPALPPCPFPIAERKTMTLGRPHFSNRYFVQQTEFPRRDESQDIDNGS
jgi:hypothetical protein